jgi:hypothetical protein
MSKIDNGGPAFPRPAFTTSDVTIQDFNGHAEQDGMTLRDYFAAKAMNALIDGYDHEARRASNPDSRTGFDDLPHKDGSSDATYAGQLADEAYLIADAMLAARNAKPKPDRQKFTAADIPF